MDYEELERRRHQGYFEGASGRKYQEDWDDLSLGGGSFQSYGSDARWKNSTRAEHYNNDHFGRGNRQRGWSKNIDNQSPQSTNYGKGPKGYVRSQERIYDEVCEALTSSPDVDAQNIEVNVEDGIVTLTGTVLGRKMKREAENAIERIIGVDDIINLLSTRGEPKGHQIDESGSPLGGNPNQESHSGNWS